MNILDILKAAQGGNAGANLSKTFGLEPGKADAALTAIVGELGRAVERNTLNRGGIGDLVKALGAGRHDRYLSPGTDLDSPVIAADGNAILGHMLGSKDKSRAVAQRVAGETGLSEAVIKQMLPVVAAMVMGAIKNGAAGQIGDILSRITGLGNQAPLPVPGNAPARPVARDPAPTPSSGGGSVGTQRPLPVPGEIPRGGGGSYEEPGQGDNPWGDLGDIIRKGGRGFPQGGGGSGGGDGGSGDMDGGALGNLIRSILGQLFGFQNKGALSWLIQLIVFRWGIGFLKRLLSRIFLGR